MALRRRQTAVLLAFVLFLVALATFTSQTSDRPSLLPPWLVPSRQPDRGEASRGPPLVVPELQLLAEHPPPPPLDEFCAQRFTVRYLEDLRDHAMQYCAPGSRATLTCYHAHARADNGVDSFCLGTGAVFRPAEKTFALDCAVRQPDANESARGIIPLERLAPYWEETGPRRLLDAFVDLAPQAPADNPGGGAGDAGRFLLLVKREGNHNLWHGLMELWSMASSFDVLRMSPDPTAAAAAAAGPGPGPAFRFPEDLENTQVVVVDDDAVEEPNFDLWRLFSAHPIVHLRDVLADPAQAATLAAAGPHRLVLPLAGASNPLWQNDWAVRAGCRAPPLLALFAQRVLGHYGLAPATGPRPLLPPPPPGPERGAAAPDIALTFVDRRGTRRLRGGGRLLAALQRRHPNVAVQVVDLAALGFAEQLRLVQATDILAGVHGAGLTHALFMREGAGAVVEIQPAGMGHVGFRNLAAMRGIKYFRAQAETVAPGAEGAEEAEEAAGADTPDVPDAPDAPDAKQGEAPVGRRGTAAPWQTSDVRIEQDRFLELMDVAIKSLYNEGERNRDVV